MMASCCGNNDKRISLKNKGGWDVTGEGSSDSCNFSSKSGAHGPFSQPLGNVIDDSDAYIAEALHNMSTEQRDHLYQELHGVVDMIEETPDFLSASFAELRQELEVQTSKTSASGSLNCRAFLLAEKQNSGYVHSEFWYKAFLRAERFDVKAAAIRMIRFYDYKESAFGEDNLCTEVTQELLSPDDMKVYRKGFSQILPCRDAAGRSIQILFPNLTKDFGTPDRMARLYVYECTTLIQDEETQRKGVTIISLAGGSAGGKTGPPMMDMKLLRSAAQSLMAFPLRQACIHNCFADHRWKIVMKLAFQILSPEMRARNKAHFGAPLECSYQLMGFGIPPDALPINMDGEMKIKQHLEFIKMRKTQEDWIKQRRLLPLAEIGTMNYESYKQSPKCVIVVPSNADVLLGRGKPIHSHPGNLQLHGLVDELIPKYSKCRKLEKTRMSLDLVEKVKYELGGRFLKQDDSSGMWLVTSDEIACRKVSHLFRARRESALRALQSGGDQQQDGSSRDHSEDDNTPTPTPADKRVRYSQA